MSHFLRKHRLIAVATAAIAISLLSGCAGGALQGRAYVEPEASPSTAVLVNANAVHADGTISILSFNPKGCYAGMTAIEPGGGAGLRVASGRETLLTFSVAMIIEKCRVTEAFVPVAGARYEVDSVEKAGVCTLKVTQRLPDGTAMTVPTTSRAMRMSRPGCVKPAP